MRRNTKVTFLNNLKKKNESASSLVIALVKMRTFLSISICVLLTGCCAGHARARSGCEQHSCQFEDVLS